VKILQIGIYQMPVKLIEPFVISLGRLEFANNIIVVIKTDEGLTGFGECSPFMTINGESMDTGFIVGGYIAKMLIGKDPLNTEECIASMDSVIYANYSIKSAFDIALHDIASQFQSKPLYKFLGGENTKTIITDFTVSIGKPEKMASDALKIKNNGFKVIKVKLGGKGSEDIERIRCIRNAIGDKIPLRIDANQGWNTEEAIETLNKLYPFGIQFCEEPILRNDYLSLARVNFESPVPVMADESCSTVLEARYLIHFGSCSKFNIKLGKSGGLFYAQQIAAMAEIAGIELQIGGFLESRLGFTASAHLAITHQNIKYVDFDTPLMFDEDPVSGGIKYHKNGRITIPEIPGLGAWIDADFLKGLKKMIISGK
jgi:L-alanine-DL-glutamate epimerase-like enolase superfamily enzyme